MQGRAGQLKHRKGEAPRRVRDEPLPYAKMLDLTARDAITLSEEAHAGLSYRAVTRFQHAASLSLHELADLLFVPRRTLARRKAQGRLRSDESDRLIRAARVFARTLALFEGDAAAAKQWLTTPKVALRGRVPFDLARTDVGAREVEALADRLEHGVFS